MEFQSWHYRLLAATETPADAVRAVYGKQVADWYNLPYRGRRHYHTKYVPDSRNLCTYFWKVVLSLFICLPFATVSWALVMLATPLFLAGVWLLCGIGWAWERLPNIRKEKPDGEETLKRPGLLRSWLKAKKDKVCPLIEWED